MRSYASASLPVPEKSNEDGSNETVDPDAGIAGDDHSSGRRIFHDKGRAFAAEALFQMPFPRGGKNEGWAHPRLAQRVAVG